MLKISIKNNIEELKQLLLKLGKERYSEPSTVLNGTSVGEHTRHIIEIFQCLLINYYSNTINYDKRLRDKKIENILETAIDNLNAIQNNIDKPDKSLILTQEINGQEQRIETNYCRELLYNLEHCIHHQALIKLAILKYPEIEVSKTFGMAASTIQYQMNISRQP